MNHQQILGLRAELIESSKPQDAETVLGIIDIYLAQHKVLLQADAAIHHLVKQNEKTPDQFADKPTPLTGEDICTNGKAHRYLETMRNEHFQILECQECGYRSCGWFK